MDNNESESKWLRCNYFLQQCTKIETEANFTPKFLKTIVRKIIQYKKNFLVDKHPFLHQNILNKMLK